MAKTTGLASISDSTSSVFHVDPRKLKIREGWNSRDFNDPANVEHIDNLAQSIAVIGVKQPLTVSFDKGEAWVEDGECRLRATIRAIETYKADVKTVPVKAEDRYSNEADRLLNQFARNTGKPFSQIELSNHFKRLLGHGWQAKDIASKAGMSPARVSQILNLQTLPETVKEMVVKREVSASTAVAMVKEHGGSEAERQLQVGIQTAKAEGKSKVMPSHLAASQPKSAHLRTIMKDIFDRATIDNDQEDAIIIAFNHEDWATMKDLLEL